MRFRTSLPGFRQIQIENDEVGTRCLVSLDALDKFYGAFPVGDEDHFALNAIFLKGFADQA